MRDVQEGEYNDFYRQLTLDAEAPQLHMHIITDAPVDIRSILYVPRKLDRGMFRAQAEHGLRLYSRKVLIQEHTKDLLPEYLQFVEGVVDSEDIPLNISRETVQSNRCCARSRRCWWGACSRCASCRPSGPMIIGSSGKSSASSSSRASPPAPPTKMSCCRSCASSHPPWPAS